MWISPVISTRTIRASRLTIERKIPRPIGNNWWDRRINERRKSVEGGPPWRGADYVAEDERKETGILLRNGTLVATRNIPPTWAKEEIQTWRISSVNNIFRFFPLSSFAKGLIKYEGGRPMLLFVACKNKILHAAGQGWGEKVAEFSTRLSVQ